MFSISVNLDKKPLLKNFRPQCKGSYLELEIEDRKGANIRVVPENKIRRIAKRSFTSDYHHASTKARKGSAASAKFDRINRKQPNSYRSFSENRTSAWGSGRNHQTKRSDSRLLKYNKQITASGRERNLPKAERIFDSIFKNKLTPDTYTYNALMNAAIKSRNSPRAFQLFDNMKEAGIQPTAVTYSTLIEGTISSNAISKAIEVYRKGSELLGPSIRSNPTCLDLHRASLAMAKAAILSLHDQNNLPKIIVVGKGNHSETAPVLRENIPSFLKQLGLDYVLDPNNNGRLILNK